MPTIEISHRDLCGLVGKNMSIEEIKEAVLYAKCEVEEQSGDLIKIDSKDTNRPDLWSTEGIAREIRGRLVSGGLPKYETKKSGLVVKVDPKMRNVRPYTACAVVTGLDIEEDTLSQIIQLQEKISMTFGRNRSEVAIGAYDLHKIKPPIRFTTTKPDGIRFIPLEFKKTMTPAQILKNHPKGKEYAHLLEGMSEYPVFIDAAGEVLSMPPIINSDHTGKVTENTRDLFIECSGFNLKLQKAALNAIVAPLADRGGKIGTVEVVYPDKKITTPDLTPKEITIDVDYVNRVSGLGLNTKQICSLLEKARYEIKSRGKKIKLLYPAYRQDIMHQRDVIEDIVISYGYNNIEPVIPKLATTGSQNKVEKASNTVADLMVGMGFQEIMSYILTNKDSLFSKMSMPIEKVVEIENVISSNWCVFRNRLLPGLLEFLSNNKHREYPQSVFEIGDVVLLDEKTETKTRDNRRLAVAISNNTIGYEELSSRLDALLRNLGVEYKLRRTDHPSFIKGRCAAITVRNKDVGVIGEIDPQVLNNWKIEKPVVAMDLDIEKTIRI
jgi:phenylalanyl-tRNA synthetase beta chain